MIATSACDDVSCPSGTMDVMGHCRAPDASTAQPTAGADGTAPVMTSGMMQSSVITAGTAAASTAGTAAPGTSSGATPGAAAAGAGPAGPSGAAPASGTSGSGTAGASAQSSQPTASSAAGEPASMMEVCSPAGAIRCVSGAGGAREQCANGAWQAATACASGEVCAGPETTKPGECLAVAAICQNSKGMRTCDGSGTLYQCDANGVIEMQTPCGSAALCMPGVRTGICAMCAPGEHRCTGAVLETCSPTGDAWTQGQTCPSEPLCDAKAGQCKAATCKPGQKMCMGDTLVECNDQQTGWDTAKSCGRGLCNASRGDCNACSPSAAPRCEGSSVVTCRSDGSMENSVACPTFCEGGRCVECMSGMTRSCGDSTAKGVCHGGTQKCVVGRWSTTCEGEVKPRAITSSNECDGQDDNCDGKMDDCPTSNPQLTCRTTVDSVTKCLLPGSYVNACYACSMSSTSMTCTCGDNPVRPNVSVTRSCPDVYFDGMGLSCA
jgi:hypothetical protein